MSELEQLKWHCLTLSQKKENEAVDLFRKAEILKSESFILRDISQRLDTIIESPKSPTPTANRD